MSDVQAYRDEILRNASQSIPKSLRALLVDAGKCDLHLAIAQVNYLIAEGFLEEGSRVIEGFKPVLVMRVYTLTQL